MPTATFWKLPDEKRLRILDAAVDEFAQHRFSDASINRVVKSAGIPRGSFYQYFKDKEDLYLLVIERISQEKLAVFAGHPPPGPDTTFFEAAIAAIPAILEWIERCPKYNQIGMLMAQDGSEFIQRIVRRMTAAQQGVLDLLLQDQRRGLIRADVDVQIVIDLILPMVTSLLRDYYGQAGAERALEQIRGVFEIIANGIATRKDPI